jgi:hypothetical protein
VTTPVGSGAVDSTPSATTGAGLDASGWAGADREDAPDAKQGRQHVPGEAPNTVILDGPATMRVGAKKKTSKKK